MKNIKRNIAVVSICFFSANASAASIDFRHEYKAKSENHASRIKMSNTFDNNFTASLELKFISDDSTDFMKDLKNNGSELGLDYRWNINGNWSLQPGMPIEFGVNDTTYKPQLRLTYEPTMVDGLSISGRYRLDIKPTETDPEIDNKYRDRYTFNLDYKIQNLNLGLEMNYYKSHSETYILYDNKNTNYENNLIAGYKIGAWTPWLEFGDVSVASDSDVRELRSRVGLRYSF